MADDKSNDPNQDAANQVKQRGMDATVDIAKEPGEQGHKGVTQEAGEPNDFSGDVEDTVNTNVTEPTEEDR